MKNNIVIVCVVLVVGCLLLSFSSANKLKSTSQQLDLERYQRMVAEEKLSEVSRKLGSLQSDLSKAQNQVQSIQSVLQKEKESAENLKSELNKTAELKAKLEQEVKKAQTISAVSGAPQPPTAP